MPGGVHKEAQEEMGSAGGDGQVRPYHFLTEWLLSGGRCECHVQGTSDCRLLRKMAEDEGQMMLTGPINGNSDVACTRPICVPASPFSFTSFNHRWCTFFFLEATQKFKQTGKRGARASHVSALGPEITERSKPFKNYQRLENHTGSNTHTEVPPCRPSQSYFQVFQTRAVAGKKNNRGRSSRLGQHRRFSSWCLWETSCTRTGYEWDVLSQRTYHITSAGASHDSGGYGQVLEHSERAQGNRLAVVYCSKKCHRQISLASCGRHFMHFMYITMRLRTIL